MINIQGFNLVTYVQKKKEVIITSCYITPYCLYAYKILVLSYHICKSASMHPPHHYLSEGCILYTAIYDSLYAQPHGLATSSS